MKFADWIPVARINALAGANQGQLQIGHFIEHEGRTGQTAAQAVELPAHHPSQHPRPHQFDHAVKGGAGCLAAILSHATAELSMPNPDLATVRAKIDEARDQILNLAEGLEGMEKVAKN